jgi:1-acyl-sn-glycerol-3-phosphate acyltransferase
MGVPPFHWWRTVFFLIPAISVYTIVLGTLSLASSALGGRGTFAHGCARVWAWLILATTGVRVDRRGGDSLLRGASYVFVANHQSIYDIPILFVALPFQLRIIAKDSLGRFPFLGWHLARAGHVLVDRRRPGAAVFEAVSERLRAGLSLLVFPEGTRSMDGAVGRFRGGIFLLAIQAGLDVVPVSVAGSRHVMRKGRLATRPGAVRVTIHEPIPTASLTADDAKVLAAQVRGVVRTAVDEDHAAHAVI